MKHLFFFLVVFEPKVFFKIYDCAFSNSLTSSGFWYNSRVKEPDSYFQQVSLILESVDKLATLNY